MDRRTNPATHIDFLLYNKISKKAVLAVEVDGFDYHKLGTKQYTASGSSPGAIIVPVKSTVSGIEPVMPQRKTPRTSLQVRPLCHDSG